MNSTHPLISASPTQKKTLKKELCSQHDMHVARLHTVFPVIQYLLKYIVILTGSSVNGQRHRKLCFADAVFSAASEDEHDFLMC